MKKIIFIGVLVALLITLPAVQSLAKVSYTVKEGDTLWEISQEMGIPVRTITNQNNISSSRNLYIGQKLTISTKGNQIIITINNQTQSRQYTVKTGDTLWKIAQRYNCTIQEIMEANDLTNYSLYTGQALTISGQNNESTNNNSNYNYEYYTVKPGDALWKIARKFNTTTQRIMEINNIENYSIYIGQELRIPAIPAENNSQNNNNSNQTQYKYYTIQSGDILWNIAQKFNTTVKKLVELNDITSSYDLYAGRKIIVPIVVDENNNQNNDNENDYGNNDDYYQNRPQNNSLPYSFYKIQKGDKIWIIADNFGIRVSELIEFNNITDINNIKKGDLLVIPLNKSSKFSYLKQANKKLRYYYRVRNNESLSNIAEYFGIPEAGLRTINHLNKTEEVHTGQNLLMPVNPSLFSEHELYKVKNGGEPLHEIAYNKGVSVTAILKANYLKDPNKKFRGGNIILVPQDQDSQATWIDYENGEPVNSFF